MIFNYIYKKIIYDRKKYFIIIDFINFFFNFKIFRWEFVLFLKYFFNCNRILDLIKVDDVVKIDCFL